jgi:type VI secretion system secreted protein Hcp
MAQKIFLKIEGIKGESADKMHRDEIEVLSWNWSFLNQQQAGGGGGGGGSKPVVSGISFTHRIDRASPTLMLNCMGGKHMQEAVLSVRASNSNFDFYVLKVKEVLISSVNQAEKDENEFPLETITYVFRKITEEFTPMKQDGTPGTKIVASWDISANQPG